MFLKSHPRNPKSTCKYHKPTYKEALTGKIENTQLVDDKKEVESNNPKPLEVSFKPDKDDSNSPTSKSDDSDLQISGNKKNLSPSSSAPISASVKSRPEPYHRGGHYQSWDGQLRSRPFVSRPRPFISTYRGSSYHQPRISYSSTYRPRGRGWYQNYSHYRRTHHEIHYRSQHHSSRRPYNRYGRGGYNTSSSSNSNQFYSNRRPYNRYRRGGHNTSNSSNSSSYSERFNNKSSRRSSDSRAADETPSQSEENSSTNHKVCPQQKAICPPTTTSVTQTITKETIVCRSPERNETPVVSITSLTVDSNIKLKNAILPPFPLVRKVKKLVYLPTCFGRKESTVHYFPELFSMPSYSFDMVYYEKLALVLGEMGKIINYWLFQKIIVR